MSLVTPPAVPTGVVASLLESVTDLLGGGLPGLDSLTGLLGGGLPSLPSLPSTGGLPGLDSLTGLLGGGLPSLPSLPSTGGLPGLDSLHGLDVLSAVGPAAITSLPATLASAITHALPVAL